VTEREPEELLLDTHQHLVYRDLFRYSWADSVPALREGSFTLADYRAAATGAGVGDTLFMETGVDDEFWQDETRFILALATDPENRIAGVIAGCRPESDADSFDAWLDELAPTRVVGFRRILHVMPDELSTTEGFVRNVRQLGKRGKAFDMCFLERQLPLAVTLARRCDNTRLVLDHCGVPDIAAGDFAGWKEQISRLAALPHVCCKISGVVAYCPPGRPLDAAVRPSVEHCIEAFGWDRLVWGSDWPVCNVTSNIRAWSAIFRELLAAESADVRHAVFRGNAAKVYGLAS
jgi:predicted TIM-barrel fold metal-dependent hydrolase